jgi:hypothetical protein
MLRAARAADVVRHPCHICTGTGTRLTPATSAPGLGSPVPHRRRDWAHPCHIGAGTRLAPCHIGAGTRLAPCHIGAGTRLASAAQLPPDANRVPLDVFIVDHFIHVFGLPKLAGKAYGDLMWNLIQARPRADTPGLYAHCAPAAYPFGLVEHHRGHPD